MSQIIKTKDGDYEFNPMRLYHGRKKINKEVAKELLFDTADILENHRIRYGLIYGTLLGAVRESDFIDWDEDVDIFVYDEDREEFLSLISLFRSKGISIVRYEGDLLSIMRDDDYLDVYFFRKGVLGYRDCGSDRIPSKYFSGVSSINFLGRDFPTVSFFEEFLRYAYGINWRTPHKGRPADVRITTSKIKRCIMIIIPHLVLIKYREIKKARSKL